MKQCSWCNSDFKPTVTYQIYCTIGCRDAATKEKVTARYSVTKRQKRKNKNRMCAGGCGVKLSIYNDYNMCNFCRVNNKDVVKALKQIKGIARDGENNKS